MMTAILIVEDEADLSNVIRSQLEAEGYAVYQAFDGLAALRLVEQQTPDLVILDWMLPGLDGLAVCRRIRENHLMPIIMLTARSEEIDRVLGLEVGADDYVVKPFSTRELMARVRAMLRRVVLDAQVSVAAGTLTTGDTGQQAVPSSTDVIVRGSLRVDPTMRLATLDGAELDLTPKEYELLLLFVANPGRAFSREYLLEKLWGYEYDGYDRTVDTHITRLRKKLGPLGEHVDTVWGVGYRFKP
jgi:DNA-binding response OmpR family regulator